MQSVCVCDVTWSDRHTPPEGHNTHDQQVETFPWVSAHQLLLCFFTKTWIHSKMLPTHLPHLAFCSNQASWTCDHRTGCWLAVRTALTQISLNTYVLNSAHLTRRLKDEQRHYTKGNTSVFWAFTISRTVTITHFYYPKFRRQTKQTYYRNVEKQWYDIDIHF